MPRLRKHPMRNADRLETLWVLKQADQSSLTPPFRGVGALVHTKKEREEDRKGVLLHLCRCDAAPQSFRSTPTSKLPYYRSSGISCISKSPSRTTLPTLPCISLSIPLTLETLLEPSSECRRGHVRPEPALCH